MKLVEQELWQREEKGLIGILPVRDAPEAKPVGPVLSTGVHSSSSAYSSMSLLNSFCLLAFLREDLCLLI